MTKHYELTFILAAQETGEETGDAAAASVKQFLQSVGAEITYEDTLGKRRFAYPIKHQHFGHYFIVEFDGEPEAAQKIDHDLRLNSGVLRYLIVQKTKKTPEELAKEKTEREFKRPEREEEAPKRGKRPEKTVALDEVPKRKEADGEVAKEEPVEQPVAAKEKPTEETPKAEEPKKEEEPAIKPKDEKIGLSDFDTNKLDEILDKEIDI